MNEKYHTPIENNRLYSWLSVCFGVLLASLILWVVLTCTSCHT